MKTSSISMLGPVSAALIFLGSASAQDNTSCNSQYLTFYNASGSVSTPGFRVNNTYEETTWTWSRYVADVDEIDDSNVLQTLGLETSPVLDLLDAESLPYTGCVFALTELSKSAANKGENDDGTCTSVFGNDCVEEIISVVNASAARLSGTVTGSSDTVSCPTFLNGLSSGCRDLWSSSISSQFLPNNFTNDATNSSCSDPVNPGSSNGTDSAYFGWGARESTDPDNFTVYDNAILYPGPIIVAVWLKDTSNTSVDPSATVTNNGWADTRLLCLPANVTEPGSRNITEAQKDSAGDRLRIEGSVFTAVAIVIALLV